MHWKLSFYCILLISLHRATASHAWEWEPRLSPLDILHADLQCTRFPSEPSKHDPLLSWAIPPSPHWWVSERLQFPSTDMLRRWPGLCLRCLMDCARSPPGRGGGRQSIYQDVLFYFFYPSPRRWFYFSENPLNSDQVRWLLSLETQELSDSNQYKCWTSTWGAQSPTMVFQGSFWSFLLLNSHPVILIYVPFQLFLQEIQIWLRHWEWTSYRQFRPSVQTPWPP